MSGSVRSLCTAGVAVVSVGAITFAPSVAPPVPRPPAIELTAAVQTTALQPAQYSSELFTWWQEVFWPSASQPVPTPPTPGPIPTPGSIPSALEGAYHAVEPWVRYGFELATYAVGWVPYVGWLSPQIMIFYNFGERIVHAIVHNTLDWLNGNGTFAQNVIEGVQWTIDAFIQLGIDEWNFFLPPLPPLPPFPGAAELSAQLNTTRDTLKDTVVGVLQGLSDSLPSHDPEQPAPVVLPGTTLSELANGPAAPTITADLSSLRTSVVDTFKPAVSTIAADVTSLPTRVLDTLKPTAPTIAADVTSLPTRVLDTLKPTARTSAEARDTVDPPKRRPSLVAALPQAAKNGAPRTLGRVPGAQVSNTVKGVQDRLNDIANSVRQVNDNRRAASGNAHSDTTKGSDTTPNNTPTNNRRN